MAKKNLLESAGLPLIGLSVFLIVTTAVWLAHNDSNYGEKEQDSTEAPDAKLNTCCDDEDKLSILIEHHSQGTLNNSCCPLFTIEGSSALKNPFSKDHLIVHEKPKDEIASAKPSSDQVPTERSTPIAGLLECTPEELDNKALNDMCSNIVWVVSCLFEYKF